MLSSPALCLLSKKRVYLFTCINLNKYLNLMSREGGARVFAIFSPRPANAKNRLRALDLKPKKRPEAGAIFWFNNSIF